MMQGGSKHKGSGMPTDLRPRAMSGSSSGKTTPVQSPITKPTENTPLVSSTYKNVASKSTVKPSPTPVSSVANTTSKSPAKPSPTPVSIATKNVTATTLKTKATSQMTTPGVSVNTTSTTLKSTPKITSVSQKTSQTSTSTMATTHNNSVTSVSSSVTVTATVNSKDNKGSKFDIGSFIGGIALTLGILSILYVGCKVYYSRRGIQYRTIDEHDAII
ncbi:PREDICTED: porimin [Miniopterus natalensis]|uniref:porimin n=1 Tax=Miniopterus natalensis TaxID=291302 RepID=UPI0007A723A2|nr:PREDICTED: porimin [Miniopterus natalensis]